MRELDKQFEEKALSLGVMYEHTTECIYKYLACICDWTACLSMLPCYSGFAEISALYPKPVNEDRIMEWFYDARVYTLQFCILRISLAVFCLFLNSILYALNLNKIAFYADSFFECIELLIYVLAYWVIEHFMKDAALVMLEVQEVVTFAFCYVCSCFVFLLKLLHSLTLLLLFLAGLEVFFSAVPRSICIFPAVYSAVPFCASAGLGVYSNSNSNDSS